MDIECFFLSTKNVDKSVGKCVDVMVSLRAVKLYNFWSILRVVLLIIK